MTTTKIKTNILTAIFFLAGIITGCATLVDNPLASSHLTNNAFDSVEVSK